MSTTDTITERLVAALEGFVAANAATLRGYARIDFYLSHDAEGACWVISGYDARDGVVADLGMTEGVVFSDADDVEDAEDAEDANYIHADAIAGELDSVLHGAGLGEWDSEHDARHNDDAGNYLFYAERMPTVTVTVTTRCGDTRGERDQLGSASDLLDLYGVTLPAYDDLPYCEAGDCDGDCGAQYTYTLTLPAEQLPSAGALHGAWQWFSADPRSHGIDIEVG